MRASSDAAWLRAAVTILLCVDAMSVSSRVTSGLVRAAPKPPVVAESRRVWNVASETWQSVTAPSTMTVAGGLDVAAPEARADASLRLLSETTALNALNEVSYVAFLYGQRAANTQP